MSDLRGALEGLNCHIGEMQSLMVQYLVPDSRITKDRFIEEIVEMLDGPTQRLRQKAARAALSQ